MCCYHIIPKQKKFNSNDVIRRRGITSDSWRAKSCTQNQKNIKGLLDMLSGYVNKMKKNLVFSFFVLQRVRAHHDRPLPQHTVTSESLPIFLFYFPWNYRGKCTTYGNKSRDIVCEIKPYILAQKVKVFAPEVKETAFDIVNVQTVVIYMYYVTHVTEYPPSESRTKSMTNSEKCRA